ADGSGSVDGVDLPVIVKQNGKIMQALLDAIVLPWTARIRGTIHLKAEAVHVGEDIIGSVVVAETRGPDAAAVDVLAAFQAEVRSEVQAVKGIADDPPIQEVAGMQDRQPRHGVHGRTREVMVGAYPDHIGIRELVVKQRI